MSLTHTSSLFAQEVTYYSYDYPVPDPDLDEAQRALVRWNILCGDTTMDHLLLRFLVGASSCTSWVEEVMNPSPVRPEAAFLPVVCLFTPAGTPTAQAVPVHEQRRRVQAAIRASCTVKALDWTAHGELGGCYSLCLSAVLLCWISMDSPT